MKPLAYVAFVALALLQGACGDGDGDSGFPTMGTPGMPSPARTGANLIFAEVDVNKTDGPLMLVDTGSPFTLINTEDFPTLAFPDKAEIEVDLTFGAFTIGEVPALQIAFLTNGAFSLPPIVGGNLTREFSTQLDYRGMQLRIGEGANPAGVEAGSVVDFELEGGGVGTVDTANKTRVSFPPTRIALNIDVEGTSHPVILDSGASDVALRKGVFDALVADGRAQMPGFQLATASGPMEGRLSRARSIAIGAETVANPVILSLGSDALLDSLAREIGHPVDGLLGGSYLREFLVTIDYPHRKLHLQRYVPPSPVPDEFKRVGIELRTLGDGFGVAKVYAGTDAAAKQLTVGDAIVSIDGQALAGLDIVAADLLLDGTVGSTKQVGVGAAANSAIANSVTEIRVDDLLPAP